jgi:hypothetical protein
MTARRFRTACRYGSAAGHRLHLADPDAFPHYHRYLATLRAVAPVAENSALPSAVHYAASPREPPGPLAAVAAQRHKNNQHFQYLFGWLTHSCRWGATHRRRRTARTCPQGLAPIRLMKHGTSFAITAGVQGERASRGDGEGETTAASDPAPFGALPAPGRRPESIHSGETYPFSPARPGSQSSCCITCHAGATVARSVTLNSMKAKGPNHERLIA